MTGDTNESKHSNANWRKILDNFRQAYQFKSPEELLPSELIANEADAGATRILIDIEGDCPKTIRVTGNGAGMTRKTFNDYHDLGSLAKHKGDTIGWAGVGAKLYIDKCDSIYTETRSKEFYGASVWSFPRKEKAPIYKMVQPRGLLPTRLGTVVEIVVSDRRACNRLTEEMIRWAILHNYNYAMQPFGKLVIDLNGHRIQTFNPKNEADEVHPFEVKLKSGAVASGVFALLKDDVLPGFELISLVVHGKTVGEQYDFKQFARIKESTRIAGFARCDELIHIITTSKDNFNRRTSEWKDFENKVGKEFAKWLDKIGYLQKIETDKDLQKMANEIRDQLNEVLKMDSIRELNLDLFQKMTRRLSTIPNPEGDILSTEAEGQQRIDGNLGEGGDSSGNPLPGELPGQSNKPDPNGDINAKNRERRGRGGIEIAYQRFPDKPERAWPDPGLSAIVINTENPAFKVAKEMNHEGYYTNDECIKVLCETKEDEQSRTNAMNKVFDALLSKLVEG